LFDKQNYIADPGQEPLRLDKFLLDRMFRTSRNKIQNAVKAGAVTVHGKVVKANYKVKPGDRVEILVPKFSDEAFQIIPDDIPLDIRHEDEELLVLHKPAGMVVHPGTGNYRDTLVNALAFYLKNKNLPVMDGNPESRPGLVHRLDKETSGLMVIAKTDFAMTHLARQFFEHAVHRRYQGIVWGEPEDAEGSIEKFVGRHPRYRQRMCVFEEGESGKWALTHFKVLEQLYYVSLLEFRLETGRTHQIRVHMKHFGHPVFNDERYGGDRIVKGTIYSKYKQFVVNCFKILPRQALHAKELGFVHPATGKEIFFDSELPEDMRQCLEKWRTYVQAKRET